MDRPETHPLPLLIAPLGHVEADLLIVPAFESDDFADVPGLDAATGGEAGRALSNREFAGKPFELFLTPVTHHWKARRIALVGAGPRARFDVDLARRVASSGVLAARSRRIPRVVILFRAALDPSHPSRTLERLLQALAEGAVLAQQEVGRHKSGPIEAPRIGDLRLIAPELRALDRVAATAAVERGRVLGECTNLARDLGNEPANLLTPGALAEGAQRAAVGTTLTVQILDEHEIEALGMGLLLGVARGSAEPPRLIVLRHEPPSAPAAPVLGLVGKGITFDTGGISIKPADGMEKMKVDMAGGAAVIGAMRAAALLNAPARVIGVVPVTENMPGGRAIKPGDVLKGASGKTVEVVNTDAEGRLVLGDGLWYAQRLGATHLVDIATLTGACVVALGKGHSGVFGRPDELVAAACDLGALTGDRLWPMPVTDDYFDQLKSEVADMSNTGGRPAGAITAAVFLKQFADEMPWMHLDIAGTALADEPRPWQAKGATGVGTRVLAELALDPARWYRPSA